MTRKGLAGHRIVVTGAAGGVGRALVKMLLEDGARVCASDLKIDASMFPDSGTSLVTVVADVSRVAEVETICATAETEFGGVDALVSNAGYIVSKPAHETSDDEWDAMMNINARSLFLLSRRLLPGMLRQGSGVIVATGSISSVVGLPGQAGYAASKGALLQLIRAMAIDYAALGIRVNAVGAGSIDTPFLQRYLDGLPDPAAAKREIQAAHPMNRIGEPEEIAHAIRFLLGPESSFVTGQILMADGGYSAR
jgi:NAD(P)-dependent dehydrogenase (short-subunit alcohol dehydrogenase family)